MKLEQAINHKHLIYYKREEEKERVGGQQVLTPNSIDYCSYVNTGLCTGLYYNSIFYLNKVPFKQANY